MSQVNKIGVIPTHSHTWVPDVSDLWDDEHPKFRTLTAEVWQDSSSQSLHCDVIASISNYGTVTSRVRVRIRRNAFDFQSKGQVFVWGSTGWTLAYERHVITALPIAAHSYTSRDPDTWVPDMAASSAKMLDTWFRTGVTL
jgi:hypothetical protein